MDASAHTLSLQQTLKGVESKLLFLGPGPHTPTQAVELQKLTKVKQNLFEQIQASVQDGTQATQQLTVASSSTPTIQQSNPMLVTAPLAMPHATLPPKPQPQVVLTKPKPPAVPPFIVQTPAANDTKIISKQRLQELIKEIDPSEQLDEDVEEMLMQTTDDFIESVVSASCELAKHRKSNTLEVKDLKLHLEKRWNISIPGYGSDELKHFKKSSATDAHKQRLALIRKATKK